MVKFETLYNHFRTNFDPQHQNLKNVTNYLYLGNLELNVEVDKSNGKWSDIHFPLEIYPPYMNGCSGHIISRNIAEYLVEQLDNNQLEIYANEDATLGYWIYNSPFVEQVSYVNFDHMGSCDKHQCHLPEKWLVGHSMRSSDLNFCYKNYTAFLEESYKKYGKDWD